ncbi:hypothetical protein I7I51_04479 [Histoplasma capsulatum]|uniref:Uncharacterized protein n=1 Tax=Ajellomyces capsulatus TaxID=5037 RepID=A0A8A1MCR9_AJECA|nr:hypothetical protein I7I51_04479 [Histoplasma capsulatum]
MALVSAWRAPAPDKSFHRSRQEEDRRQELRLSTDLPNLRPFSMEIRENIPYSLEHRGLVMPDSVFRGNTAIYASGRVTACLIGSTSLLEHISRDMGFNSKMMIRTGLLGQFQAVPSKALILACECKISRQAGSGKT